MPKSKAGVKTSYPEATEEKIIVETKKKSRSKRILQTNAETLKSLKGLGRIQATYRESAAFFGVCLETFRIFLRDNEKARDVFEDSKQAGKTALRRLQIQSAEKGNVTMQIWLGKQMLGQTDRTDQRIEHGVTDQLAELMKQIDGRTPRIPFISDDIDREDITYQ